MNFFRQKNMNRVPQVVSSDIAVVWDDATAEVVLATYSRKAANEDRQNPEIHTLGLSLQQLSSMSLAERIRLWRASLNQLFDAYQTFLLVPVNFNERTRMLPLEPEVLELDDDSLTLWLVQSAQMGKSGADSQPIFERPLIEVASDFTRLPDGSISLTQVPRQDVAAAPTRLFDMNEAASLIENLSNEQMPQLSLRVETPLRAMLRSHLHNIAVGGGRTDQSKMTALLYVTSSGVARGLWNDELGFVQESGELFGLLDGEYADEFQVEDIQLDSSIFGESATTASAYPDLGYSQHDELVAWAIEKLQQHIDTDNLVKYGANSVEAVVWMASPDVVEHLRPAMKEFENAAEIKTIELGNPTETIAKGLLLGSNEESFGAQLLPVINLASDLLYRADAEEQQFQNLQSAKAEKMRLSTLFAMLVPFLICVAVIVGSWLDTKRVALSLYTREYAANKEAKRLEPIAAARKSYVERFKWYESYIQQTVNLRKRQTAAIGLYADLDSRWPLVDDQTFYVSELRTSPTGQFEIKGLTKQEESVTAFVRSLEFSPTDSTGKKLFTNLVFDVKRGVALPPGVTAPSTPAPGAGGITAPTTPGLVAWVVRGSYSPLSSQQAKPPVQPNSPAQNQPQNGGVTNPVPAQNAPAQLK